MEEEAQKGPDDDDARSTLFRWVLFYSVAAVEMNRESRACLCHTHGGPCYTCVTTAPPMTMLWVLHGTLSPAPAFSV